MPKILRIANRFNLGGPTYNVAYLTKYISPEFETLLVGGEKDDTEEGSEHILEDLGIKPLIIPEMKREIDVKEDRAAYNKIKKIIKEFKPDIVHTHASKAGTLGRLAAFSTNVPVVVHTFHGHVFHSYFGKLKTEFYKNIERYLALRSSKIIAISEKQKEELSQVHKICPASKIAVVPLGFDLNKFNENKEENRKKFRTKYKVADDELVISIIGRIVPVKNHELFLKAVKNVKDKTSKKIRAFIVGDGEDRQKTENFAISLGLDIADWLQQEKPATVTFTSWIKDVELVTAGSDIIAMTSLNEGTPVSLIEAQAAGKPIVSTNVGGIENITIPDVTALLSERNDVAKLSDNLLKLIEDDKLRSSMSSKGWEFVREKYHYTRLTKDMETLYLSLLAKHNTIS
ncbi:MAG: D-inositol-3-phosphate glycosyltransferase [Bacteroidia bacterium]|nr:D-inositol-3-phosphate glycosyltransferase [Bacteroidia bacterium]